jgi:DNA-binding FadR family transcriptional regulator
MQRTGAARQPAEPPQSHTAHVMREIGLAIVSGRYSQNTILPGDAELMDQFKVSRTVLREAMKTLGGKGLIQSRARIGTRVRDRAAWNLFDRDVLLWHAEIGLDQDFTAYLNEMRLALEPEGAALAAERRSAQEVQEIYEWVERMTPGGSDEFVHADLNFHLAIAAAAGNPFLRSISTLIEVALNAVLTASSPVDDPSRREASVQQHRAIAQAIDIRDAAGARAAMRKVIETGIRDARQLPRKKAPDLKGR